MMEWPQATRRLPAHPSVQKVPTQPASKQPPARQASYRLAAIRPVRGTLRRPGSVLRSCAAALTIDRPDRPTDTTSGGGSRSHKPSLPRFSRLQIPASHGWDEPVASLLKRHYFPFSASRRALRCTSDAPKLAVEIADCCCSFNLIDRAASRCTTSHMVYLDWRTTATTPKEQPPPQDQHQKQHQPSQ